VKFSFDTSAVAPLFIRDAHTDRIEGWFRKNADEVFLSNHWLVAEFCSAALRLARRENLPQSKGTEWAAEFASWAEERTSLVAFSADAGTLCADLSKRPSLKLSAGDALHLAIAIVSNATLVTLDDRLADAARARNHPVIVPPPLAPANP
jgi:uncharacterized protein